MIYISRFVCLLAALGAINSTSAADGNASASRHRIGLKLAEQVRRSPWLAMRGGIGDREEPQLTALGQSVRANSVLVDGALITDRFGLNMTGFASFFEPFALETLEDFTVEVSPYDVRRSGFTGALIDATTKSGGKRFSGSVYYVWAGDTLAGLQMQGADIATRKNTGRKVVPQVSHATAGFTFGGPIIRDRLFFYVAHEKFDRSGAPAAPGLLDDNDEDMSAFINRLAQYNTASGQNINWGESIAGTTLQNTTSDEKKLAKLDWNILTGHRLSLRYSSTEGELLQQGKYQSLNVINSAGLTSSGATALDTHIYTQQRNEEVWGATLSNEWTPNFRTALRYTKTDQDQETPLSVTAPEVAVFGVRGISRSGAPITNAAYVAGTEFSRHGNAIFVDGASLSVTGAYVSDGMALLAGVERDEHDFFNIFRQGSFGTVVFRSLADFIADRPADIRRNAFDPAVRGTAADVSDLATNAVWAQAYWDAGERLSLQAGVRLERLESEAVPAFNERLLAATGIDNTHTLDGASQVSPRLGFEFHGDGHRPLQVSVGVGHFVGRAPWVFFSNSFNAPGVGDFSIINSSPAQGSFTEYLRNFDPENPVGTGVDNPNLRRSVNWVEAGIKMPAVWRGNFAVKVPLPVFDSAFTIEYVHTLNDEAFFISNENLRATGTIGADGRVRFAGNPGSAANALHAGYTDLFRLRNVSEGESRYVSVGVTRPSKGGWGANLAYTRGRATEAQALGQTTASGLWQRNVVFNQGQVEIGTADTEIKDRVQFSYTREFEVAKHWTTRATLYYEGRTGDPFSWVYSGDLNGDGQVGNDLVAVPSGIEDPRFDFSGMSASSRDAYLAFFANSGLARYAGGVAPRNAFNAPWVNRLDLRLTQAVPLYAPSRFEARPSLELFLDFINIGAFLSEDLFGYFEEPAQKHFGSELFRRNRVNGAVAYGSDGRIRPTTFTGADTFVYENGQSRWRIQAGARLSF